MVKRDPKAPVTNQVLDDAINHVVETLGGMIEVLGKKVDTLSGKMEKGFAQASAERQDLKRQISDLKADTVTQKEFEELKAKVDRFHPTN